MAYFLAFVGLELEVRFVVAQHAEIGRVGGHMVEGRKEARAELGPYLGGHHALVRLHDVLLTYGVQVGLVDLVAYVGEALLRCGKAYGRLGRGVVDADA